MGTELNLEMVPGTVENPISLKTRRNSIPLSKIIGEPIEVDPANRLRGPFGCRDRALIMTPSSNTIYKRRSVPLKMVIALAEDANNKIESHEEELKKLKWKTDRKRILEIRRELPALVIIKKEAVEAAKLVLEVEDRNG